MSAITCNDTNFQSDVLQSDVPVLVDFWAPWCGPCKAMSPLVDEIADEFDGRLKVVKVDVGEAPQSAARYGVTSIPNFTVIAAGEVKSQMAGATSKQALIDAFNPHLN